MTSHDADKLQTAPAGEVMSSAQDAQTQRDRRRAVLLFTLTVLTTSYAGLVLSSGYQQLQSTRHLMGFDLSAPSQALVHYPTLIPQALSFPLALLTILGCHEMGHYLQARRWKVPVSPPFFIPSVPPLGTFGAIIRMDVQKGVPANALMHVAASGPIAGMIPALIALILGLAWSDVAPLPFDVDDALFMHGGVLVQGLEAWLIGPPPPGYDVVWHPVAFAGWAGCFVTALNMLPIGQLDGGHVVYGLWPKRSTQIAYAAVALLIFAGIFYIGWWIIAALLVVVIGVKHPPIVRNNAPARGAVRWLGVLALILFVLTVHPAPISDSGVGDLFTTIRDAWAFRPMGW